MNFVIPTKDERTWNCIGSGYELQYEAARPRKKFYRVVRMHPMKFIELVQRGKPFRPRKDSIEFIVNAIRSGQCFSPPEIWPRRSEADDSVVEHEGRHRAYVASMLGIQKIPIIVWKD